MTAATRPDRSEPHHESRRKYRRGLVLVFLATALWSLGGLFSKGLDVDAWTILYWRGAFGFLSLAVVLVLRDPRAAIDGLERLGTPGWLWCIAATVGMVSYVTSVKLTSVAHNTIIWATLPFICALLALVLLRERPRASTVMASVLALAGIAVMFLGDSGEGDLLGDLLAFTMTLGGAATILLNRRFPRIPTLHAAGMASLLTAAVAMPLASPADVSLFELGVLFLFGISQAALGMTLMAKGAQLLPASETALIGALDAPMGIFWVWLALGIVPLPATLAGGVIVLSAVVLHVLIESRLKGLRQPAAGPIPDRPQRLGPIARQHRPRRDMA
jgi:drug/metabolite transporter (DMT)-like permease